MNVAPVTLLERDFAQWRAPNPAARPALGHAATGDDRARHRCLRYAHGASHRLACERRWRLHGRLWGRLFVAGVLADLPISGIKCDRLFVRQLPRPPSPVCCAMSCGLHETCSWEVVVEGVETGRSSNPVLESGGVNVQATSSARPCRKRMCPVAPGLSPAGHYGAALARLWLLHRFWLPRRPCLCDSAKHRTPPTVFLLTEPQAWPVKIQACHPFPDQGFRIIRPVNVLVLGGCGNLASHLQSAGGGTHNHRLLIAGRNASRQTLADTVGHHTQVWRWTMKPRPGTAAQGPRRRSRHPHRRAFSGHRPTA